MDTRTWIREEIDQTMSRYFIYVLDAQTDLSQNYSRYGARREL